MSDAEQTAPRWFAADVHHSISAERVRSGEAHRVEFARINGTYVMAASRLDDDGVWVDVLSIRAAAVDIEDIAGGLAVLYDLIVDDYALQVLDAAYVGAS